MLYSLECACKFIIEHNIDVRIRIMQVWFGFFEFEQTHKRDGTM